MNDSRNDDLRDKLMGLGKSSMRKNYYAELLQEKQKLELQNQQLMEEIQHRKAAEEALLALNEELEARIAARTADLEQLNQDLKASYTDLKQAHEYLVQTEKLAALGALVAGISHEVNTPLGICVTTSTYLVTLLNENHQLFKDKKLTVKKFDELCSESLDCTDILINNLHRSVELLENFKLLAVDQTHYEYRSFYMKDYTQRILTNLYPETKKRNVEITITCEDSLQIKGYPGILAQLLSNLVMNSLIHGFVGEGPHHIQISYDVVGDTILMEYADNGCGMDSASAKRAFDPFYTTRRGSGGSGLGLFIVYNLVTTRLMGTITLDTAINEGARFTIRVPVNHKNDQLEDDEN